MLKSNPIYGILEVDILGKGERAMSAKEELLSLVQKMNEQPDHIKEEKDRVFQFQLDDHEIFQVKLSNGQVTVMDGEQEKADVTIKTSEKNFSKLLKDELNTTMAFMTGGLKIEGNLGLAMKLQEIIKKYK